MYHLAYDHISEELGNEDPSYTPCMQFHETQGSVLQQQYSRYHAGPIRPIGATLPPNQLEYQHSSYTLSMQPHEIRGPLFQQQFSGYPAQHIDQTFSLPAITDWGTFTPDTNMTGVTMSPEPTAYSERSLVGESSAGVSEVDASNGIVNQPHIRSDEATTTGCLRGVETTASAQRELRCLKPGCNYKPSGKAEEHETYLKRHEGRQHVKRDRVPCDICGCKFTLQWNMLAHRKKKHSNDM
ncbi:hypothetical protein F4803DRAFT_547137 [Xylaria telfairii]|nr:hypothetical protein F4803DRAFT_547137 [Xylaria telfairii]